MANTAEKEMNELRRQVRACIKEAMVPVNGGAGPSGIAAATGAPPPGTAGAGGDMIDNGTEKKSSLNVSVKPDATIQSSVVDITKSAAYGLERLELLKKRDFPTHKSANAVSTALDALEMIFQDMLKNPMGYLDEDPTEKVAEYEQTLDSEEAMLSKGAPATF